jgi:hypothetical protein
MIIWKPQIWYIYVIDENIKRLQPPLSQFLLSVERIEKWILNKSVVQGGGGGGGGGGGLDHIIMMIFGHLSWLKNKVEGFCRWKFPV